MANQAENSIFRGIISDLCDVYDDKGVAIWLGAPQKWQGSDGFNYTGHTALDLIKDGHAEIVAQRAEQLATGAFS